MGRMAEEVKYYELDDEKREYIEELNKNTKICEDEKKKMILCALGEIAVILGVIGIEYLVAVVGKENTNPEGAFLGLVVAPSGLICGTIALGKRFIEGFQERRYAKSNIKYLNKSVERIENAQSELKLTKS